MKYEATEAEKHKEIRKKKNTWATSIKILGNNSPEMEDTHKESERHIKI